ncbi:aspartyl protease family protein [Aquimarina brevivitae]|uniref:Aspartyl protease n=1 Tax=Aquimarina brevivitae TaxID=323412 RepID=A0A4Q7NYG6_9FLAO|nr:aspartyl protease family protein [Aquimarina brevivitae]RZS92463.1 hypothetical protein EV197_2601 [Aquimarina brevivitae]
MKPLKIIFCLALTTSTISCSLVEHSRLQSPARMDNPKAIKEIPFTYEKDLIIVTALANNSKLQGQYIFDTGAFYSKIENSLSNTLELPDIFEKSNGTAQGVTRMITMTKIDSLTFVNHKFYDIAAGKLSYDKSSASRCVGPQGIIGSNLIKLANWKVDYKKRLLTFSSAKLPVDNTLKSTTIPFSTSTLSGIPEINIQLGNIKVEDVIFDVGYNGGLILPMSYLDKLDGNEDLVVFDQSISGIFGTNRDTIKIKRLPVKIGTLETEINVEFSTLNKILLGNDFLEHFLVYLDYDEEEITLQQTEKVEIKPIKTFIPGFINDSLWIVNRTTDKIPIKLGDTLREVNGKKPNEMFNSFCDYIKNINSLYTNDTLRLKTMNGQHLTIKL